MKFLTLVLLLLPFADGASTGNIRADSSSLEMVEGDAPSQERDLLLWCWWCKPAYTKPDYTKPDYTKPDYTKPDYTKPEYTKPEYTKPPSDPNTSGIEGRLFIDSNKNYNELTNENELESPIHNEPVRLLDESGNLIKTTTTNQDGIYSFSGLSAGKYRVQVPQTVFGLSLVSKPDQGSIDYDSDFLTATGLSVDVLTIGAGEVKTDLDAGYDCFSRSDDLGNLVCNGSFEYNTAPSGSETTIALRDIPGWRSINDQSSSLKLFNNFDGITAVPVGSKYAQLDNIQGGNVEGIFQDIPTMEGQQYLLTFFVRAREPSNADTDDEAVVVSLRNMIISSY